jgi:AraC-like DNA-binding protein
MTINNGIYTYERFFPAEPLAAFVKFFYYFLGPGHQPYFVVPGHLHRVLGICFHPWGLHALFKLPPGQLAETKIPLTDALPVAGQEMTDRMLNKNSPREMITHLEEYLAGRIGNIPNGNSGNGYSGGLLIRDALRFIDSHHGLIDLPEFYNRYSQSNRRLQMIFEQSIGLSPKKYSRLKRFHYTLTQLTSTTGLTSLALDTGYYDQAHFIHEFKAFAGTHPGGFLQESNQLNAINARSWF